MADSAVTAREIESAVEANIAGGKNSNMRYADGRRRQAENR